MNDAPVTSDPNRPPLAAHAQTLAELTRALSDEIGRVRALDQALLAQRAGVAGGSAEAIHGSADAIGRELLALEAAKRRRASLVEELTGRPDTPLEHIERAYAASLPREFGERRRALREAAGQVTRSAAINRGVLRRAIEAGDAYLQALFSAADPSAGYGPERRAAGAAGALLNRRA